MSKPVLGITLAGKGSWLCICFHESNMGGCPREMEDKVCWFEPLGSIKGGVFWLVS